MCEPGIIDKSLNDFSAQDCNFIVFYDKNPPNFAWSQVKNMVRKRFLIHLRVLFHLLGVMSKLTKKCSRFEISKLTQIKIFQNIFPINRRTSNLLCLIFFFSFFQIILKMEDRKTKLTFLKLCSLQVNFIFEIYLKIIKFRCTCNRNELEGFFVSMATENSGKD